MKRSFHLHAHVDSDSTVVTWSLYRNIRGPIGVKNAGRSALLGNGTVDVSVYDAVNTQWVAMQLLEIVLAEYERFLLDGKPQRDY